METCVELDGVLRDLRFSACHFIPGHEKCSRLHGHDYFLNIKLYGRKGADGMLLDFSKLKEYARELISMLDHRVILPAKSPAIKIEQKGDEIEVWHEGKHYLFPASDCVVCEVEHVTAEALAEYICNFIAGKIMACENVEKICCGVSEGTGQTAWFERGLKACG
ncbi:MAG: 6-pyruvoyl tetrahydropterin synthase family protein [Thermoplasmata archaeon]|nr:6-pyruvoyl tetrahydropterin synthase family protein [Thermoplasmata archaeon]